MARKPKAPPAPTDTQPDPAQEKLRTEQLHKVLLSSSFNAAIVTEAYLSTVYTPLWVEGMVAGRGWIALALTVFAGPIFGYAQRAASEIIDRGEYIAAVLGGAP